jgi:Zn ribbon nucleic-acid-binding protein
VVEVCQRGKGDGMQPSMCKEISRKMSGIEGDLQRSEWRKGPAKKGATGEQVWYEDAIHVIECYTCVMQGKSRSICSTFFVSSAQLISVQPPLCLPCACRPLPLLQVLVVVALCGGVEALLACSAKCKLSPSLRNGCP